MTNAEIKKYREILEAKQSELIFLLRNREGIEIEKSPDALDEVQRASERELAIRTLDRESSLLRNVRAALQRIDIALGQPLEPVAVYDLDESRQAVGVIMPIRT